MINHIRELGGVVIWTIWVPSFIAVQRLHAGLLLVGFHIEVIGVLVLKYHRIQIDIKETFCNPGLKTQMRPAHIRLFLECIFSIPKELVQRSSLIVVLTLAKEEAQDS